MKTKKINAEGAEAQRAAPPEAIVDRIREILAEEAGIARDLPLLPAFPLADVPCDGLDWVNILIACEQEFFIRLQGETGFQTLGELVAVVTRLVGEKEGAKTGDGRKHFRVK